MNVALNVFRRHQIIVLTLSLASVSSFGLNGGSFARRVGPGRASSLTMSYSEAELNAMSLSELKTAANVLGITDPEGHKGRKVTWIDAISGGGPDGAVASAPEEPPPSESMEEFFSDFIPASLPSLAALCRPGASAEPFIQKALGEFGGGTSLAALPEPEYSEDDLALLATTMDFLQDEMLKVGDVENGDDEDPDFIAEGRKILALNRFVVAPKLPDEAALLEVVLREVAALVSPVSLPLSGEPTGALLLTPGFAGGDVKTLLGERVGPALRWLGLDVGEGATAVDLKGYRFSEGAPCPLLRLLFQVDTSAVEYGPGEGPEESAFGDAGGGMVDGNALVRELAEALKAEDEAKAAEGAVATATAELKANSDARQVAQEKEAAAAAEVSAAASTAAAAEAAAAEAAAVEAAAAEAAAAEAAASEAAASEAAAAEAAASEAAAAEAAAAEAAAAEAAAAEAAASEAAAAEAAAAAASTAALLEAAVALEAAAATTAAEVAEEAEKDAADPMWRLRKSIMDM